MKIAFVIPKNTEEGRSSFYDYSFFSRFLLTKKYYSYLLAVPTLVSLTPPEHEIRVFDENIEDIDYNWKPDLAGITVRTMFASRAYSISEALRKRGIKTVLGGIHPSMCHEEALQYCDSVVIGEAEDIWQSVLQDAQNGKLKNIYKAPGLVDLTAFPTPDRSLLSINKYFSDVVQTTKGCPFNCEFCSVHAFDGQKIRNKTVDQVLQEIKSIHPIGMGYKKKAVFFADDNIIANKQFAKELFQALKPLKVKWGCQASINAAQDEELLTLMKDSGCGSIFIGFESISEKNLFSMNKNINLRHSYADSIQKIQSHGIIVIGSFILGYDFDTQESFDELVNFIDETNILTPLINVLTPFPGTKLFKRFEKENRIIHKDWSKYDTRNVVFRPALLSPDELLEGYNKVIKAVYSFDAIYKRLKYYHDIGFWVSFNKEDPIKLRYRTLFAARLLSLLPSKNIERSKFIIKILPNIFSNRYRISNILTLMAYNDFAYE